MVQEAEIFRVSSRDAGAFGFGSSAKRDLSGLVYIYRKTPGLDWVTARLRCDTGSPKYLMPTGRERMLYRLPNLAEKYDLGIVVESEKSVLAITAAARRARRNVLVVATGGCWGWLGHPLKPDGSPDKNAPTQPLPDLALLQRCKNGVVLLPDSNVAANRDVREANQGLAAHLTSSDVNAAAAAFQWGASAYVLKQSDGDELITAVRRVLRGESYLSPLIARETIECLLQPAKHQTLGQQLTLREIEVLQLLAEGRSMKEVAQVLEIASRTAAFHKYKMMEKLGIRTNAGLFQYAMKHYMTHIQGSWVVTDSHGVRLMEAS